MPPYATDVEWGPPDHVRADEDGERNTTEEGNRSSAATMYVTAIHPANAMAA
jgi:hypothetical protein